MSEILSTREAALRLGVTPQTIARWIRQGAFPNVFKLNPNAHRPTYRIPISDIETFEADRGQKSETASASNR